MAITESFDDKGGRVEIVVHANGLTRVQLSGVLEEEAGLWLGTKLFEVFQRQSRVTAYWDLEHLVRYHPAVRSEATRALKTHLCRIESLHVFAVSAIVRMGVSVANLALGGIVNNHPDRARFESHFQADRAAA